MTPRRRERPGPGRPGSVVDLLDLAAGLDDDQIAVARARLHGRRRPVPLALESLRRWAREHGLDVPGTGPIPAEVKTAWRDEQRRLAESDLGGGEPA